MRLRQTSRRLLGRGLVGCLGLFVDAAWGAVPARPKPPPAEALAAPSMGVSLGLPQPSSEVLLEPFTRATVIGWALQNNPDLMALRQQHGIAAAAVVIANTYPFNPVWVNKLFAVNGPEQAGINNRLAMEQRIQLDVEIRGQRRYRRQVACATLTRTDWEIANQETLLAVRVVRAFDNVVYQQAKLRLSEEHLRLQEEGARQVATLVNAGRLRPADRNVAQAAVYNASIARATAQSALARAENDLRAALGLTHEPLRVTGRLAATPIPDEPESLVAAALEQRPDLHARQAAVREADARLRLTVADRYGNPNIAPDYEYNETRVNFIGAQVSLPLPLLNTHRGDILQREAERTRAALDLRSVEIAVQQQVYAALSRLQNARDVVKTYETLLPHLESSLKDIETLFTQGAAEVLNVLDVRRNLMTARSSYLDALYELRQAYDDLALAVADPALTLDGEVGAAPRP